MRLSPSKNTKSGFTLIELITVVSIIALLFSLVVGGFSYAERYSKRQKSEVSIKAIRSALENYSQEFGGYPDVNDPNAAVEITKKSYIVGGAACLYQAMTGDGFDAIKNASGEGLPSSNGEPEVTEAKNIMLKNMPRELFSKNGEVYFMIDGFGHPIRYAKAVPVSAADGTANAPTTINQDSYDIWALNEDDENLTLSSLEVSESATLNAASQVWTKNW